MFLVIRCWAKFTDSARPLSRCSTRERSGDWAKPSWSECESTPSIRNTHFTIDRMVAFAGPSCRAVGEWSTDFVVHLGLTIDGCQELETLSRLKPGLQTCLAIWRAVTKNRARMDGKKKGKGPAKARGARATGKAKAAAARSEQRDLNARLQKCTEELGTAQSDLESFCFSISHDLRAPLRSIDGFGNALLHEFGEKLEPQAREYLRRIVDSSKKMGLLIDELLVISRIQRTELAVEEVNLTEMAESIIARLRKSDPHRKVLFLAERGMRGRGDRALIGTL